MTSRRMLPIMGTVLLAVAAGCSGGGGASAPAEPQAQAPSAAGNVATLAATQAAVPKAAAVDPDRKETKWIGTIPYDVFYDQPLTIAADTSRIGGSVPSLTSASPAPTAPATAPAGDMPQPSTAPTASAGAPAGEVNWQEIMPMNVLIDEIKLLRTRLSGNLQTVATFNQNTKAIAVDGAILSAMAAIVTVHPENTSWKENAHIVRDLGYQVFMKAEGAGRTPFLATSEPFETAMKVIDGGTPPASDAEAVVPFADVVYRSEAMKRIETTFGGLKSNINTEARLKEDPVAVERDLRVITALAAMIGTEDYDFADEPKYQEYIKTFVSSGLEGVDAVKIANYDGFRAALDKIQKTCGECHQQYLGSDTGF